MLKEQKNSRHQGDVGLGTAIAWFVKNGYTVCLPISESQRFDLVVDGPDGLQKVEIKTTYHKAPSGNYKVMLKTCGGNQSWNKVSVKFDIKNKDLLLFILTNSGQKYLMPATEANETAVTLCERYDKYKVK